MQIILWYFWINIYFMVIADIFFLLADVHCLLKQQKLWKLYRDQNMMGSFCKALLKKN